MVDALNSDGIAVTWEEVLDNNGAPVAESAVQKKMLFELMARKGYSKSWDDAKLMIKTTPRYQINRKKPAAIAVIQAIHEAGGIAILAHPYLVSEMVTYEHNTISRDEYIRAMLSAGLDGIEVNYPYDKTSYGGNLTNEQIADEILEKYGALVNVLSGVSDYHADHKKGVKNARQIGEAGIEIDYFNSNPYLSNLP